MRVAEGFYEGYHEGSGFRVLGTIPGFLFRVLLSDSLPLLFVGFPLQNTVADINPALP